MSKVKVGQKLFSKNIGNAARNRETKITPVTVVKVGRKYFTTRENSDTTGWTDTQYFIDTWAENTNYNATSKLYGSLQDHEEEQETTKLHDKIRNTFGYRPTLKLDTLRRIVELIEKDQE